MVIYWFKSVFGKRQREKSVFSYSVCIPFSVSEKKSYGANLEHIGWIISVL